MLSGAANGVLMPGSVPRRAHLRSHGLLHYGTTGRERSAPMPYCPVRGGTFIPNLASRKIDDFSHTGWFAWAKPLKRSQHCSLIFFRAAYFRLHSVANADFVSIAGWPTHVYLNHQSGRIYRPSLPTLLKARNQNRKCQQGGLILLAPCGLHFPGAKRGLLFPNRASHPLRYFSRSAGCSGNRANVMPFFCGLQTLLTGRDRAMDPR